MFSNLLPGSLEVKFDNGFPVHDTYVFNINPRYTEFTAIQHP